MRIKTGGSAFPEIYTDAKVSEHNQEYGDTYSVGGMTLRDYFAAKAMQGMSCFTDNDTMKAIAERAYAFADAMLSERDKDGTE